MNSTVKSIETSCSSIRAITYIAKARSTLPRIGWLTDKEVKQGIGSTWRKAGMAIEVCATQTQMNLALRSNSTAHKVLHTGNGSWQQI
jgi:hypothetical protein